jgi:hypothetical protein
MVVMMINLLGRVWEGLDSCMIIQILMRGLVFNSMVVMMI